MANILIASDSVDIPSGFGVQANYLAHGLASEHKVFALGFAHRGTVKRDINLLPDYYPDAKITMVPNGSMKFGQPCPYISNDIGMLRYWLKKLNIDILITLADMWMTEYISTLNIRPVRWIRWIPLDSEVMLPFWRDQIKNSDIPVTFAKFANKLVKDTIGIEVEHISHGVNTDLFRPLNIEEREKNRKGEGIKEDSFIILMVGRNQTRKMQPYLFKAFGEFARDRKDVKLLCHFDFKGDVPVGGGPPLGWDLYNLMDRFNIRDKVIRTVDKEGFEYKLDIGEDKMSKLYPIADVHYNSGNEGFGVPAMESNACGVPNISPDYTTAKELTDNGNCGVLCKYSETWFHPICAEWCIPDHKDLASKFELLYNNKELLKKLGENARKYAVENYDWKIIIPKWKALIDKVLNKPPETDYAKGELGI